MEKSLRTSFVAHFIIIIVSSISLPFLTGKVQAPLVISVDLVQIGDKTNIPYAPKVSDGEKTDKKIKERVVTEQAPPKIVPKEKPDAVPMPDDIKQIKELLEKRQNPVKVEDLTKQTSEFEKKEIFDPNKISALIDKSKQDSAEANKKTSAEATQSQQKNVITSKLTITQEDAIKAQIFKCWNIPIGLPYNENLTVRIKIKLNPDGSLISSEIMDQVSRSAKSGQNSYKVLAESALRAVRLCNPLKVPSTGYEKWREMQLNFDAKEMLKG
jgi:outer membrane biosynthesis protein TonB